MSSKTGIEWTDATWNPVRGCTRVSEGCRNCYAEVMAARFSDEGYWGHGLARRVTLPDGTKDHRWTGKIELVEGALTLPMHWKKPRLIFVNSTSDLFHEDVPFDYIDGVFAVMALCPQHTFQVLTKRPERMRVYIRTNPGLRIRTQMSTIAGPMPVIEMDWPLPNVWLGTSVEDQVTADARIPHLLDTPAAVRFISAEPLLGPVDLTWIAEPDDEKDGVIDALLGCNWIDGMGRGEPYRPTRPGHQGRIMTRYVCSSSDDILANRKLDWVIVGGESGPGARPMHVDWARDLRDQCQAAGVAFFFKQFGDWSPGDHLGEEHLDGARFGAWVSPTQFRDDLPQDMANANTIMFHVGKKAAGRLLDGREWNDLPGGQEGRQ